MREIHGRASAHIDASPDDVFDLVTDIQRLPEWNRAIEAVLAQPDVLGDGGEWTVRMHPPRAPGWGSVSRVETIDRATRRFAYETRNTDGNPSFTKWSWQVSDDGDVTVTWDVYLKTLDRRMFAGPLRKRQLAREVPRSLASLGALL